MVVEYLLIHDTTLLLNTLHRFLSSSGTEVIASDTFVGTGVVVGPVTHEASIHFSAETIGIGLTGERIAFFAEEGSFCFFFFL